MTPVLIFIYNRPNCFKKLIYALSKARPQKIFIASDGPNPRKPQDNKACQQARDLIKRINWTKDVYINFSEKHCGCQQRVVSGIDWAFGCEDELIILEDDCIPHPSFFRFCETLLDAYRRDDRIMMVSGFNILGDWNKERQSYFFSCYGATWGWATWKRAWKCFDAEIKQWEDPFIREHIRRILGDQEQYLYREQVIRVLKDKLVDTWDYQWNICRLIQSGLSIVPSVNLVSNIGFGKHATHTKDNGDEKKNIKVYSMDFPLRHPQVNEVDHEFDRITFEIISGRRRMQSVVLVALKAMSRLKRLFIRLLRK